MGFRVGEVHFSQHRGLSKFPTKPLVCVMGAPKEEFKKPTDSCSTYLTLVQQYLAVFQFDNAVWLAERCVAEYPKSQDAVYALAQCYYRSGKVRNARALLLRQLSPTPSMAFLAAQCCYDLGDYRGGENIIMKELRTAYEKSGESGPIDDWIVQTTVRAAWDRIGSVFSPNLAIFGGSHVRCRMEPLDWHCWENFAGEVIGNSRRLTIFECHCSWIRFYSHHSRPCRI
jgi:tetratricopeptide (TPR) repeat protein